MYKRQHLYRALDRSLDDPERAWFRNVLWAPNIENGYSAETFPTLRAAAKRDEAALERELARFETELLALGER